MIASTDIKDLTAQSVCVQCYALRMVTTVEEFVTAKKDGRVRNVTYLWLSVNYPPAPTTVDALRATATVSEVGKDYTVNNRTVLIHHALAMARVYLVSATVKLDGKATTVAWSTSRYTSVFRPALIMEHMI